MKTVLLIVKEAGSNLHLSFRVYLHDAHHTTDSVMASLGGTQPNSKAIQVSFAASTTEDL